MKVIKYILPILIAAVIFVSWNLRHGNNVNEANVKVETNVESKANEIVSTRMDFLATLIDLSVFEPSAVKYKYGTFNNRGYNQLTSIPKSNGFFLEAILYFDEATMTEIRNMDISSKYIDVHYKTKNFNFDWLPEDVKSELNNSSKNYQGTHDYFLGKNMKGQAWYLKDKILFRMGGC